jgi:MFS family permease
MALKENPVKKVFGNPNFRLLWSGQSASVLGDQFEMIAAPWLVLKLTNDPLALGLVLALSSIPRALFMLVGGAITDRFSSRTIMLISDAIRLLLCAGLALAVYTNSVQMWMVYGFALCFGLISGFFFPASSAMVPKVVGKDELQAGNSLMSGTSQLSSFLGPVLAGGLIAVFSGSSSIGLTGIAIALGVDALSFAVSFLTLLAMRLPEIAHTTGSDSVFESIKAGIRYALNDPFQRVLMILIAAANLFVAGPLGVGMPVLAQARLAGGAAAFGLVMSAYGGGNLGGILLAGVLPRPKPGWMNVFVVAFLAGFGLMLCSYAFITSTWLAFALMLIMGVGNGYFAITMITMIQQRTPAEMLGRVMSLVFFANMGLMPISQAISGLVLKMNLSSLFIGAGTLMILLAVWAGLDRGARTLGEVAVTGSAAD